MKTKIKELAIVVLLLTLVSLCFAAWDNTLPADNSVWNDAAGQIRDNWDALEAVLGVDLVYSPISEYILSVKSPPYNAEGDGVTDDTTAIQAALDASSGNMVYFPPGTYLTGVLDIGTNVHIRGDGATLEGSGNGLFQVSTGLDKVYIEGLTVTWSSATGTIGKQFFWNGTQAAGSTSLDLGTIYAVTDLRIFNNNLGSSRIAAGGATTEARIYGNRWVHANTVAISPAYIALERGNVDSDSGPVWIEDNYFNVYPPSGANVDIIKVNGGITEAVISNNYIKNNTTDSGAQVDVFTGAHKMRFIGNTLINTQLHRKQIQGAIPAEPEIYHWDLIMGNSFELQDTFDSSVKAIYFIGALGTITNNQFILENASEQSYCIDFDASDVDITFDTDESVAKIVSNNIFDCTNAESTSVGIQHQAGAIGASEGRYTVISGNIMLGGGDFLTGPSEYSSMIGNVWGDSANATGTSMNIGPKSMAIGNVADTSTPIYAGRDSGNIVSKSVTALADEGTPSVFGLGQFTVTGGTANDPITDLDDGYAGQSITILCKHSVTFDFTTAQDADHNLDGSSADITADSGDILDFYSEDGTTWHLISNLDASVDNN